MTSRLLQFYRGPNEQGTEKSETYNKEPENFRAQVELNCASPADEVHDDRDHGEDQQDVDQEARHMEQGEATEPEKDEDDCENEEHWNLLSWIGSLPALVEPNFN